MDASKPVVVFSSLNVAEAHLVVEALARARVKASLLHALRVHLMGEIPATDARAEVVVAPHDAAAAMAVLDGLKVPDEADDWRCGDCGEANPSTFEVCWQCGRAFVA